MICLIVGISLVGYIAYKFLGKKVGIALGGILGGLISSTATTVSYARKSANGPGAVRVATIVVQIASAIVFARVLLVIRVISPTLFAAAERPLLIMMVLMAVLALVVWFWGRREQDQMPSQENPSELKGALLFGLVFAMVLLATAGAKARFGQGGLYIVAVLSGLTDMDAITVSTAQLVNSYRLVPETGWRLVLVAALANLVFKGAVVMFLGHRQLLASIGTLYGVGLIVGTLLLWTSK
jgi:uncharacterized membrane protein (DUF4010 family)